MTLSGPTRDPAWPNPAQPAHLAGVHCVGFKRDEELIDQVAALLAKTRKYEVTGIGGLSPTPAFLLRAEKENEALAAAGRYAGGGGSFAPDADVVGRGIGWKAQ